MSLELLVGGRIYTPTSTTATALAVENGIVSWIGEDHAARALHPDAQVTDLAGAFVAPAFVDTHAGGTARALDAAAAAGIAAVHVFTRDREAPVHGVGVRRYWEEPARDADHARDIVESTGADALAVDAGELDQAAVTAHLLACTEAGVQASFHATDAPAAARVVAAFDVAVGKFGGPRVASGGHRIEHASAVTPEQAAKLGDWGAIASVFPLADAPADLALLARNAVSLAIASGSAGTPAPWAAVRAATQHPTPGSAISPRAAFAAATRGAWRAGGVRDGVAGTLVAGAPATFAVWDAGELVVRAPSDAVQRWSTDPRAGVAPLPDLAPGAPLPRCLRTVVDGGTVFAA